MQFPILAIMRGVNQFNDDYDRACKEGIPFLGSKDYKPTTEVCKDALEQLQIVKNVIKRNVKTNFKEQPFKNGSKVCVIGWPFRHYIDKQIHLSATYMFEDSSINRDMEINYKSNLMKVYETKYLKFKISGESADGQNVKS